MNGYSPWRGYLRGQSPLPLESRSVFESLAVASDPLQHPCPSVAKNEEEKEPS